jgi:hypothetical protein
MAVLMNDSCVDANPRSCTSSAQSEVPVLSSCHRFIEPVNILEQVSREEARCFRGVAHPMKGVL